MKNLYNYNIFQFSNNNLIEDLPPLQPSIDGNKNLWISKPIRSSKGKGIKIFQSINEIEENLSLNKDGLIVNIFF